MSIPVTVTIDRTEEGVFRAELPGQTIVGATFDELMDHLKNELAPIITRTEMKAVLTFGEESEEEAALREIEKTALRGPSLDRLAALSPPPQSWFDEPEL
jgi:hypothetical protein